MNEELDWGFTVAYTAVLQADRAFMFAKGYRPATAEGHKNTFTFLAVALGLAHADLVTYFDRMRNKRNKAVYGMAGRIAETEARNILTTVRSSSGSSSGSSKRHPNPTGSEGRHAAERPGHPAVAPVPHPGGLPRGRDAPVNEQIVVHSSVG
jgi:uncharacterized protein (UPF0332 family)